MNPAPRPRDGARASLGRPDRRRRLDLGRESGRVGSGSSTQSSYERRGRLASVLEPVPLAHDVPTARRFLAEALRATPVPGEGPDDGLTALDGLVTSGSVPGVLFAEAGRPLGLALWEPPSPIGLFVLCLYFEPSSATVGRYREAIDAIERSSGPIAFVGRELAGLPPESESELMADLGFGRYGRSEMRFPASVPPPEVPVPRGISFRPPVDGDRAALATLHRRAYDGGLDRYLFLAELDPVRDAERAVAETFAGRHGEFLSGPSIVAEQSGSAVGACLVVRASYGPLIVDVMVDPGHQGRGLGRAMVSASVARLRAAGETVIALNVTEGNASAVRAYAAVGFVRTIGPQWGWYARARLPVRPGRV